MKQVLIKSIVCVFVASLAATAAAAEESPIGNLAVKGAVKIDTPASSFTLRDQDYAYFSDDKITTTPESRAVLVLNEGLRLTFVGDASGSVARSGTVYNIDLERGHILLDADSGVDYRIYHDGEPVSADHALNGVDKRFVVSVAEAGDVQFYMPAQLDDGGQDDDEALGALRGSLERAGVSAGQVAAIIAALTAGAIAFLDDDGDPAPVVDEDDDVPIVDEPIPADDDGPAS